MYWEKLEDHIFFEKIRRRRKKFEEENERPIEIFSPNEIKLMNSQVFGSIHSIENIKLKEFSKSENNKKEFYEINKIRPGVVITSPSKETNYETEWIPMSSKIYNRNPKKTVLLLRFFEDVRVDSVLLLEYRYWFKFKSLSERRGKLSPKKQTELKNKLDNL